MISILRNAGFGVPLTVSRQANVAPACVSMPERSPTAAAGDSSCAGGEPILRDPERERARFQRSGAVRALRDAAKSGGQRDGDDGQRDEHLDQREAGAR